MAVEVERNVPPESSIEKWIADSGCSRFMMPSADFMVNYRESGGVVRKSTGERLIWQGMGKSNYAWRGHKLVCDSFDAIDVRSSKNLCLYLFSWPRAWVQFFIPLLRSRHDGTISGKFLDTPSEILKAKQTSTDSIAVVFFPWRVSCSTVVSTPTPWYYWRQWFRSYCWHIKRRQEENYLTFLDF